MSDLQPRPKPAKHQDLARILDKIEPAFLEHVPFRVLLAMAFDAMSMHGKFSFMRTLANQHTEPAEQEKAFAAYAFFGQDVVVYAWDEMLRAGLVEDEIPPFLRQKAGI